MRKLLYCEPLKEWSKFFLTLKLSTIILNIIFPAILVVIFYFNFKDLSISDSTFSSFYVAVLTVLTLIIGFSYSMIVSLITSNGDSSERLKVEKLDDRDITMFEGMLSKFYFVILNLIILLVFTLHSLITSLFEFYNVLIILYIMLVSLLVLIEGLTNLVSVFKK